MAEYESALAIMHELFTKDYQFALATVSDNIPSLRYVDTYFDGEAFYIATYDKSQKVKEITENPHVSLCARKGYAFSGFAENRGHPLAPQNQAIREHLTKAFSAWYFAHNNENDEHMCYVRVVPTTGFFHHNGTGYKVDFKEHTVLTFPFSFDTVLTEE